VECPVGLYKYPLRDGYCIDCNTIPQSLIDTWALVDQFTFKTDTCPTWGQGICGPTSPVDVPCIPPVKLSSNAANSVFWLTVILLAFVSIAAAALFKWRRTRAIYAASTFFLATGMLSLTLLHSVSLI
jgi:hypothetical protein